MEVVLLLVALTGIALIAVPRLQARRAGAGRTGAKSAKSARRRRAAGARAAAAPVVAASWAPAAGSDEEVWDDDLGWEGERAGARRAARSPPRARRWDRWRAKSPLAGPRRTKRRERPVPSCRAWTAARAAAARRGRWTTPKPAAGPRTGSGRRRPRLGGRPAQPATRCLARRATRPPRPPRARSPGRDAAPLARPRRLQPAPAARPRTRRPTRPRPRDAPDEARPSARRSPPRPGRSSGRSPRRSPRRGDAGRGRPKPASTPAAPRRRFHPVLLVAAYAAAGIGIVVAREHGAAGRLVRQDRAKARRAPHRAGRADRDGRTCRDRRHGGGREGEEARRRGSAPRTTRPWGAARRDEAHAIAKARTAAAEEGRCGQAARRGRRRPQARRASHAPGDAVGLAATAVTASQPPTHRPPGAALRRRRRSGHSSGGGSSCEFCIG